MKQFLILDYETRSEADLKKTGGYEYARHDTTTLLCASWRFGSRESLREQMRKQISPKLWRAHSGVDSIEELSTYLKRDDITIVAHNALFEQVITRFVLPKFTEQVYNIPHERWMCTASLARALALPANLEGACAAIKLPIQKDMEGRKLMLKYSKPRKATKNNTDKFFNDAEELNRISRYCMTDVDAETLLFLALPELSEMERKVWLFDQKVNFRGFLADRDLVDKALTMIDQETNAMMDETFQLSGGQFESTNKIKVVREWLENEHGVFLPNLAAGTIRDALKEGLATGEAKRMLEIRQACSKTSNKKYDAFEMRSRTDSRIRDILIYHGASTGRWTGSGVQPQNFPKGNIADPDTAADAIKTGDREWVRALYGNPMDALSSCLRSVIVAPKGKELFCADYAAIEARVLFWVAKHDQGLAAYHDDRPIYEEMAMVIFGFDDLKQVTKWHRNIGKQVVLGCGYGMGWKNFIATCEKFGIDLAPNLEDGKEKEAYKEQLAKGAVNAYRSTHSPVVKLWSNIDKAAIAATQRPGSVFKINRTAWWVEKNYLWCRLPSGRKLAYYGPEIKYRETPWGEKRPELWHYGVHPKTRKWVSASTYGGRLTENVVQAISRDLMAEAMLRIENKGYQITLSVHDELLAERRRGEGSVGEFEALMAKNPDWGLDIPIRVEGWMGERYKK